MDVQGQKSDTDGSGLVVGWGSEVGAVTAERDNRRYRPYPYPSAGGPRWTIRPSGAWKSAPSFTTFCPTAVKLLHLYFDLSSAGGWGVGDCTLVTSQPYGSPDSLFGGMVFEYRLCALLRGLGAVAVFMQHLDLLYNNKKKKSYNMGPLSPSDVLWHIQGHVSQMVLCIQ